MAKMNPKEIADYRTLLLKRCADLRQEKHRVADALKRVAAELRDLERPEQSVFISHSATDVPPTEAYFEKPMPLEKLRGMSQAEAIIAIAKHFGGIVRTIDLARILQEAGLMTTKKNKSSIVNRLIATSERFVRVATGLYRLKSSIPLDKESEPVGDVMLTASRLAMGGPGPIFTVKKSVQ